MFSHSRPQPSWATLPVELKLSIVDQLDLSDVQSFSTVNRESYNLSVPSLFRCVNIASAEALQRYAACVPKPYHRHIRQLTICTKRANAATGSAAVRVSEALVDILPHCTQVEQLTLNLAASLAKAVIPCFEHLLSLKSLSIDHCGDEARSPLSERLVVAIAASVPNLRQLSLDRITRSAMHAPDLVGARPFVPVVKGDDDIPDHPILGRELRLPALLRLPTLKKLRIRDTHLGDPQWECTPVYCTLEVLDLGSCYHETNDYNRACTERIMGNIGHTVDECALNTALTSQTFAHAKHTEKPLKKLRKVHLTPLFPVENVVDTLTTLSDSPVESLSVQCHEDDVVDMCSALTNFLNLRAERGEKGFYQHLNEVNISTVSDLSDALDIGVGLNKGAPTKLSREGEDAVRQLQEYCRDLRIQGASPAPAPASTTETPQKESADAQSEKPAPAQERVPTSGEA
ncbi:hypothetical protein GY45DRAFT_1352993 [Cubamyces sp. BRFM 1775]|nr:hypothetical protein GY45DRAFT_1352993 [Cubamyces sp. BRFM 1775]